MCRSVFPYFISTYCRAIHHGHFLSLFYGLLRYTTGTKLFVDFIYALESVCLVLVFIHQIINPWLELCAIFLQLRLCFDNPEAPSRRMNSDFFTASSGLYGKYHFIFGQPDKATLILVSEAAVRGPE